MDEDVGLGETAQAAKAQPGDDDGCPPWACGSNSPEIDFKLFHELHELHGFNPEGFQIVSFEKKTLTGWDPYRPDVVNGELFAKIGTATIYSGTALVGMRFVLFNNITGLNYYMTILAVDRAPLWAKVGRSTPSTPTYQLGWSKSPYPTGIMTNLCGASNDPDGVADFQAVLFDDDRIDADAMKVTAQTSNWFNIGCAGHALAKQHLTGNTKAAAAILGVTAPTLDQRTANLKMLSADYCGGGNPFTVAGQPLLWKDSLGRVDTTNPMLAANIEARWNENGAICLNTPRVDFHLTWLGSLTFPGQVEPLLVNSKPWCNGLGGTHLRPPPCTNANQNDFQGAYLISVNKY